MPTPAERRALIFVAVVATLGTGVRGLRAFRSPEIPRSDREALATQIARVDSAIASGGRRPASRARRDPVSKSDATGLMRSAKAARPVRVDPLDSLRHAPIDLDRADVRSLDLLPGIGPALAARIVADREANGPFGSLDALQRVKGVGPALATRLAPYVTFSRVARQPELDSEGREVMRRP